LAASDPNNYPLTIAWNYGDGNTGDIERHTYSTAGTYTASITVTNGHGGSATSSCTVTVGGGGGGGGGAPPVITTPVAAYPNPAQTGKPVLFTIAATDPNNDPLTVQWNYGDGTTGYIEKHTYSNSGTYTVVATVTDGKGGSVTSSVQLVVGG